MQTQRVSYLDRRDAGRFLSSRLRRLGIPLVLFLFVIGPLTLLVDARCLSFYEFLYTESIHFGPVWFVEALLLMSLAYAVVSAISRKRAPVPRPVPGRSSLLALAALLSALTFLARWRYPMGEGFAGMQFGSFPQYIAAFVLGILARRGDWLTRLSSVKLRNLGAGGTVATYAISMMLKRIPVVRGIF